MNIRLIAVPFDSGYRERRMGAGPRRLLEGGAVQRLQRDGFQVRVVFAEPESSFTTEIGTAFELHRRVATLVSQAIVESAFPVILSGNCNTAAIGALGAIGAMQPSIVWLDGHADFCTPETAEMGFLDGMGLAMATGRCWTSLTRTVPGFRPVPDDRVVLVGAHEIEARESEDLRRSGITQVPVHEVRKRSAAVALSEPLSQVRPLTSATYLHVDLDVHDSALVRANHLAPGGGLTAEEVAAAMRAVVEGLPVRAASVTAYDPDCDPAGTTLGVALNLLAGIAQAIARREKY